MIKTFWVLLMLSFAGVKLFATSNEFGSTSFINDSSIQTIPDTNTINYENHTLTAEFDGENQDEYQMTTMVCGRLNNSGQIILRFTFWIGSGLLLLLIGYFRFKNRTKSD